MKYTILQYSEKRPTAITAFSRSWDFSERNEAVVDYGSLINTRSETKWDKRHSNGVEIYTRTFKKGDIITEVYSTTEVAVGGYDEPEGVDNNIPFGYNLDGESRHDDIDPVHGYRGPITFLGKRNG